MGGGTAAMYYLGTLHVLAGTLTLGSLIVFSAYLADVVPAARVAHLHRVGDGRRDRRREALL